MIKPYLTKLIRNAGLLKWFEELRFYVKRIGNRSANVRFQREHPNILIPPDFFLYETYVLDYASYYSNGQMAAAEIAMLVSRFEDTKSEFARCLDWGCGPARLTRHLPGCFPNAEIFGIDYNDNYIKWCQSAIEGVRFSLVNINPPTAFPDSYFDFIIGLSVFTHLSEENHFKWITELSRMLRPGGILYVTTQGESYARKLLISEKKRFDGGLLVLRAKIKEGNRLYSAFQPPSYFQSLFDKEFKLLTFIPGKIEDKIFEQDRWILRKK